MPKKVKYGRKRSSEKCPVCELKYEDFKTGYNFQSISELLWNEQESWPNKRRHGRLGKLHELKLMMWDIHVKECSSSGD